MSTRFFTNDGDNTLLKKFAGVFAHNPDIERFDALVGYLRASGFVALRLHLEKVPFIRILVGIDVDALLAQQHRKGLLLLGDAGKTFAAEPDIDRLCSLDIHFPHVTDTFRKPGLDWRTGLDKPGSARFWSMHENAHPVFR